MQTGLRFAAQESLVDGVRLRAQLSAAFEAEGKNAGGAIKALLGETLFQGQNLAKARLEAGENGWVVSRLLCGVADQIVSALFDYTTTHVFRARNPTEGERLALVAVGGYGRGELAPFSDLDLLFLRPYKQTPFSESVTEYLLYTLWDLGLKVGQSSRNLDECIKLARQDYTIQTALLEARCVAGDASLAGELSARYRKDVTERGHAEFIAAKLKERDARHLRVGASRYMVEPNIKEGKGGLRDLHTLFWMARRRYGFTAPREYIDAGVFTAEEFHVFRRALSFLWSVRCHLHFVAGRAEEKLTFDFQPELAKRLGYHARAGQSAVERFMRRYFLVAKEVGGLTRILCAKLEADHAKSAPRALQRLWPARQSKASAVAPGFHVDGGRLCIDSPAVFDAPANLIGLFATAEARDLDIHPIALREAARCVRRAPPNWRRDEQARAAFLSVATSQRNPGGGLRLMNEAGVLGRFVPEFGRVVGQMQFNMYHHYTVDEHTLQAVEAMAEIEQGRHQDQHPLATEIFAKIINRRALYLAMLLHDTGKGDGDQQIEGAKSARAACERLGLPADEVELVAWLVGNHLLMSELAQKRDISDPRTVAQLVNAAGSVEHLRMLLVLTVADIRAVGPGLWNDWKGQLLRDLYRLTEAALHGGRSDEEGVRAHMAELAAQARQELAADLGGDDALHDTWLTSFEDGYWLNHDAEALAWHAREMRQVELGATPYIATRVRPAQGITEVLIYADDHPGLFANLAAAISAAGADIAGARVHTTRGGAAFDVFSIQTTVHKPFGGDDRNLLTSLAARLRRAAVEDHSLPPASPPSRRNSAFSIEPWVRIDNEVSQDATVIEASGRDRLGLLAELAHVCAAANVSIVSAHIDTHGARASDVFYVQETAGGKIVDPARIAELRASLEIVLAAGAAVDGPRRSWAVAPASTAR